MLRDCHPQAWGAGRKSPRWQQASDKAQSILTFNELKDRVVRTVYSHIRSMLLLFLSLGNCILHLPPFLLASSSQAGMIPSCMSTFIRNLEQETRETHFKQII